MAGSCVKLLQKIQSPKIETDNLGRAKSFRIFSIRRPHMRSFHSSWFCFFLAFTSWFGIQPLIPTIRKELGLRKVDIAYSGTASIAATIAVRVVVGPLCDRYGPRRIMSALLISGAIPMALAGLVKDATGLIILRLCIGVLGGSFVPCQFWTTAMFHSNVVGTANALVGGWGNLGGGFTFILMPYLFELVKVCGADEFLAWKVAVVIPAFLCIITGISILFTSDDCPQGEWRNKIPLDVLVILNPSPGTARKYSTKSIESIDNQDLDKTDEKTKSNDGIEHLAISNKGDINGGIDNTAFDKTGENPPTNDGNGGIDNLTLEKTERVAHDVSVRFQDSTSKGETSFQEKPKKHLYFRHSVPSGQTSFQGNTKKNRSHSAPFRRNTTDGDTSPKKNSISRVFRDSIPYGELPFTVKQKKLSCRERFWVFLTVVMFIMQYGLCFGVEISVNTVMNLYFLYKFKIDGCSENEIQFNSTTTSLLQTTSNEQFSFSNSTTHTTLTETSTASFSTNLELNNCSILDQRTASLIASLFGLMNLFARAMGGATSDVVCKYKGIPGRLLVHFICLALEGTFLIIFSQTETISSAIGIMVLFSLCVQMSEGTTYSLVPYILPRHVGIVSGLVGAGGNIGALIWTNIWTTLVDDNPSEWFFILGIVVLSGSLLTLFSVVQDRRIWHIFSKNRAPKDG